MIINSFNIEKMGLPGKKILFRSGLKDYLMIINPSLSG